MSMIDTNTWLKFSVWMNFPKEAIGAVQGGREWMLSASPANIKVMIHKPRTKDSEIPGFKEFLYPALN